MVGLYEKVLADTLRRRASLGGHLSATESFQLIFAWLERIEEKLDAAMGTSPDAGAAAASPDVPASGAAPTATQPRHTLPTHLRSLTGVAGAMRGITKIAQPSVSPAVRP